MTLFGRSSLAVSALLVALALATARPAAAATWTVTSLSDDLNDQASLRYALQFAANGDTINITAIGTIHLGTWPLDVNSSVTITGPGADKLTIDGGRTMDSVGDLVGPPVFVVNWDYMDGQPLTGVTAAISGLTIANGNGPVVGGGGIVNAGTLTLTGCTLANNMAERGGAIANLGTLELDDCTLSGNSAVQFGAAIVNGGRAQLDTALTIKRCVFTGNTVTGVGWIAGGGAISNIAFAATAALSIEDSTLSGNSAQGGGAILNLSAGDNSVDPAVPGHAEVTIRRSSLSGNSAASPAFNMGGAIFQMTGENPETYASLLVDGCTLSGNTATSDSLAMGGAIVDYSFSHGSIALTNSTLVGNSATNNPGATSPQGAIGGAIVTSGTLSVDNCTLSGNLDVGSPQATGHACGIAVAEGGVCTIKNTLLANDPSGPNLWAGPAANGRPAAVLTSLGCNLSTDDGGGYLTATGDQLNTDPLLGPLADNGGPTWTCALLAGSPAIDAAASTDSAGSAVTVDQRGIARPQGAANDIGAFEQEVSSALNITDASVTTRNGRTFSVTVTVTNPSTSATAYDVTVTGASLGGVKTNSVLPLLYGALKPGASKKCTLQFKGLPTGAQTLTVEGTCSLGPILATRDVTVP